MSSVKIDQNKNGNEYRNPATSQKDGYTPKGWDNKTHIAPSKIGSVELEAPAGSSQREDVSPFVQADPADEEAALGTRFSRIGLVGPSSKGIAACAEEALRRTSSCQWW